MKKKPLIIILCLAVALRLFFAFKWHEIWWDSAVYIGMGKYIFSGGASGLFESIRPPFIPFVLGAFWWLNLDPVLFGRLFEILAFAGVVWLTYKLARTWFEERTAILTALIVSFSPIFLQLSVHQYTEIPAVFLTLLGIFLFTRKQFLWSGTAVGLAFLAKFPAGMFIIVIGGVALLNKKWKDASLVAAGFCLPVAPYLVWSWITLGNLIATLMLAQDTIARAMGCNVLRYKPWWQYGIWLFGETKLHVLAIPGIYVLMKNWSKKYWMLSLSILIPVIYFAQLHCRDYRYMILFLPFASMLTALGAVWLYDRLKLNKKWFIPLLVILGIWMAITAIGYYHANERQTPDALAEEYYHFLDNKQVVGEIWTANPIVAVYTDAKVDKIYYPIFDQNVSTQFFNHVADKNIEYVFLDNCGGGIICPEEDCMLDELHEQLDRHMTRVFDKEQGRCWYRIWFNVS